MTRIAALLALALTLCITSSSAFIRHSQAGLGCADQADRVACLASSRQSTGASATLNRDPITRIPGIEPPAGVRIARLAHRISAVVVGLLAGAIALVGWSSLRGSERAAAAIGLLVTAALAWLGRFTPHDLPLVTLGNVLGGFALAAAYAWILAPGGRAAQPVAALRLFGLLAVALLLATVQAALGVMISVRHVVDACASWMCWPDLPVDWRVFDPLVARAPDSQPSAHALHLAHRTSALALVTVGALATIRARGVAPGGLRTAIGALLLLQVLVGAALAAGLSPLFAATAHNTIAGALIAALAAAAGAMVKTRSSAIGPG